jgi:hypothetical protein
MTATTKKLSEAPTDDDKQAILEHCFSLDAANTHGSRDWRFASYFHHYARELGKFRPSKYGKVVHESRYIQTHGDLIKCFDEVRKDHNSNKEQVIERLRTQYPNADDLELEHYIELSLRIGLLVNVRSNQQAKLDSLKSFPIYWDAKSPLKQLIGHQFPRSRWKLNANESRLHPRFTVAFMVKVCGLTVDWADCLANHLYLNRQTNTLYIFPHKACLAELLRQTDWASRKSQPGPIP